MSCDNLKVRLSIKETVKILDEGIVTGSITGERVDYHVVTGNDDIGVVVLVYEKHFYRAGNRLTLTITVDNMSGVTKVHSVGAGGGEGLFKFDWGASEKFTSAPRDILQAYLL